MAIKMVFHYNTCYLLVFSWYPMSDMYFCQAPFVEERLQTFSSPMKKSYTDNQCHFICIWLKEQIVTFDKVFHFMSRQQFWMKCLRILVNSLEGKNSFRHATFSHVQVQWVHYQYCESPRHF